MLVQDAPLTVDDDPKMSRPAPVEDGPAKVLPADAVVDAEASRESKIRRFFNRNMRLIEIGPSHQPIVPKQDGWQTTVIDHASQADLVEKYRSLGIEQLDRIEPVDHVWHGEELVGLVPKALHGSFDGAVASHVGEHLPNFIGFLQQMSDLLKPTGIIALALPDKRVCFDFFQPLTATGDLIAAHAEGRTRHQKRTFFNQAAYFSTRSDRIGWTHSDRTAAFHLPNKLSYAQQVFDDADDSPGSEYRDTHAWVFTPKSFELIILELNALRYFDWTVRSIEAGLGVEFLVWLERRPSAATEAEIEATRLGLLMDVVLEAREAADQVAGARLANPHTGSERSGVSAIIPLYNGARFIEQTLMSVLRQSLPADEIIVVDDGSSDGGAGAAVVEGLARSYPIRLLRKANGGQGSARNFGVCHSTGKLIAFLDQDDIWHERHLEELVKPFSQPSLLPLGWAYSNLDEIDQDGRFVCRSVLSTFGTVHPKRSVYDCLRQDMMILPSAAVIAREAFEACGGFDERLRGYEDDDLFLRVFRLGYDNVFVDQPLGHWRIYPSSCSYSARMAASRGTYVGKLADMFPDEPWRARYHTRDAIAPRFFDALLRDHAEAMAAQDNAAASDVWQLLLRFGQLKDEFAIVLLKPGLSRYKAALISGERTVVAQAWQDVWDITHCAPNRRLYRLHASLRLIRNPAFSQVVFAARRALRPVMLWAFRL